MIKHTCDAMTKANEDPYGDDLEITLSKGKWFIGNRWDGISDILYCPFCGMELQKEIWDQNPSGETLETQKEKENTNV